MAQTFNQLQFIPSMNEIISSRPDSKITILTGGNNSGKSAYLKKTIIHKSFLYIGVNRFYTFHHLTLYSQNPHELDAWFSNQNQTVHQQFQNFEGSYFSCANALVRLSNERQQVLFDTFCELFGVPVDVRAEDPLNDFSNKYVSIGGESLSVTSSGTRLFLGILSALMDDRFSCVCIDEPELGLSPPLQRKLADIIIRGLHRDELFPHKPHIVLSTHSHLFLDKDNPSNNYVVSKSGDIISAVSCSGIVQLHEIQFGLLGNDLNELFLPDIVMFVEGETDKIYLEKIVESKFPSSRIVIQACGGDISTRLSYWAASIGDLQVSPYRTRTFVIYDKVMQSGMDRLLKRLNIPENNRVQWDGNGIEYVYPIEILAHIFKKSDINHDDLTIEDDFVACGDVMYKKMDLCKMVTGLISSETMFSDELMSKLLMPLRDILRV